MYELPPAVVIDKHIPTGIEIRGYKAVHLQAAHAAGRASRDGEVEAIHQAITDPENQPSQFGTVTLAMYEKLESKIELLERKNRLITKLTKDATLFECLYAAGLEQERSITTLQAEVEALRADLQTLLSHIDTFMRVSNDPAIYNLAKVVTERFAAMRKEK